MKELWQKACLVITIFFPMHHYKWALKPLNSLHHPLTLSKALTKVTIPTKTNKLGTKTKWADNSHNQTGSKGRTLKCKILSRAS